MVAGTRTVPQDKRNGQGLSSPVVADVMEPVTPPAVPTIPPSYEPAFTIVPGRAATDPALSDFDYRVLAVICGHANRKDRICWPRQVFLAAQLDVKRESIARSILRLRNGGYLRIRKVGFPARSVYQVLFDSPAPALPDALPAEPAAPAEPADVTLGLQQGGADVLASYSCNPGVTSVVTLGLHDITGTSKQEHSSYSKGVSNRNTLAAAPGAAQERVSVAQRRADRADGPALLRDPLYIELAAVLGGAPDTPGTAPFAAWVAAINDLKRQGATPEDIPRAVVAYASAFPSADEPTVWALAKHFPRLRTGVNREQARTETVSRARSRVAANRDAARDRERTDPGAAERAAAQKREIERQLTELADFIRAGKLADG